MRKASAKPVSAEKIAEMADLGNDISNYFSNQFSVVRPDGPAVQRVNVDFGVPMLAELDREADSLNVSRQAVIKMMLRDALDRRYLAATAGRGEAAQGGAHSTSTRKAQRRKA